MVVPAFSYMSIVRVIRVVVVSCTRERVSLAATRFETISALTSVIRIGRVERLDTQRTDKDLLVDLESLESVHGVEQLGGDRHGNGEVASELVVGAIAAGGSALHILVDTATGDELRLDRVVDVLLGVCDEESRQRRKRDESGEERSLPRGT
jgi:hypothetical protein